MGKGAVLGLPLQWVRQGSVIRKDTVDRCDAWDAHRMNRKVWCTWSPKYLTLRTSQDALDHACSLAIPNIATFFRKMKNALPSKGSSGKATCVYKSKLEKCMFRMKMDHIDGDTVALVDN